MNHWSRPVNKQHVPIVWVLVILFLVMFLLGLCQEYESSIDPESLNRQGLWRNMIV